MIDLGMLFFVVGEVYFGLCCFVVYFVVSCMNFVVGGIGDIVLGVDVGLLVYVFVILVIV